MGEFTQPEINFGHVMVT